MHLLTGSLQAFRLHEVLSLIARKSGLWRLDLLAERQGYVAVRDGCVISISADTSRQDFARRLVVEGAVGTTTLANALRSAGDEGVVGHLAAEDLIEPGLLPELAAAHVATALADLTHWRQGTFTAAIVEQVPDDVGIAVPLSELGAQVTGLLTQWRSATDRLGGMQTVVSAQPGEVPVRLRGLYALVDGQRCVSDLIELSGHGVVGTVVDLGDLVAAGCAAPMVGDTGAVERQLAMLSVVEEPPREKQTGPVHLAVIQGGLSADGDQEAAQDADQPDDLLSVILRGVRGV